MVLMKMTILVPWPFVLSSLICMRIWSSGAFTGVKLAILSRRGLDLLSSFLSLVRVDFLPLSG